MLDNHWIAADGLAARLGLPQPVRDSVEQTFERWDGKGVPKARKGPEIAVHARLVALADVVEVYHHAGGTEAAIAVARQRRGTQFDPGVVDVFTAEAAALLDGLDEASSWDAVIAAAPATGMRLAGAELDAALEAIADFADVKSPYTIGHSRGVADLAGAAAGGLGLDDRAASLIRRAGLVHDLGRLGVPNTIWDKPAALSRAEDERVRMHPYLTERMLTCAPALAPLAAIAGQHHERLDGSGYPRGLSGSALSPEGRVLAAADFYHSRTEPRPHRPAATPGEAAAQLRAEVRAGRMDGEAAAAVLTAAGHRAVRRAAWPAGLTSREVEVLRFRRCSVAERRRGGVPDPLPQRHGAAQGGVVHQVILAEMAGGEADGTGQEAAAGLAVALGQLGQRRAPFTGHALGHALQRQPHGLLGQEHQGRPPLLGGAQRDQERHGDFLRVFQAGGQADHCLTAMSSLLRNGTGVRSVLPRTPGRPCSAHGATAPSLAGFPG